MLIMCRRQRLYPTPGPPPEVRVVHSDRLQLSSDLYFPAPRPLVYYAFNPSRSSFSRTPSSPAPRSTSSPRSSPSAPTMLPSQPSALQEPSPPPAATVTPTAAESEFPSTPSPSLFCSAEDPELVYSSFYFELSESSFSSSFSAPTSAVFHTSSTTLPDEQMEFNFDPDLGWSCADFVSS